jgi:hypothetical protein
MAAISAITVPNSFPGGCIYLIPDAPFTTDTGGNIALASRAIVNRTLQMCWDGKKWYPSY